MKQYKFWDLERDYIMYNNNKYVDVSKSITTIIINDPIIVVTHLNFLLYNKKILVGHVDETI